MLAPVASPQHFLEVRKVFVSVLIVVAIERKSLSLAWSVLALVASPRHFLEMLAAAAFERWGIVALVVSHRHFLEAWKVFVPAAQSSSKVQQVLAPVVSALSHSSHSVLAAPVDLPLHPS